MSDRDLLCDSPQLTDLYQLTMLQGYLDRDMHAEAVFEFFVRKLPDNRNFLLAAGLEQLLEFLECARFSEAELDYLGQSGFFGRNLIDYLANFRFTGSVHALPEGTLFFGNEPLVRITAPLPQAQLIETRLINLLQLPVMIASKAARCRMAAGDALLVDFGLRRAHGAEAGLHAARAAYIGGFDGTSNVLAGQRFGVPLFGTMAHAFVQAHDDEMSAFRSFANSQPDNLVLLIDTYDTDRGARRVAKLADELASRGVRIKAVRIDSGELGDEARRVRVILDQAGHPEIGIFVSSSLDEYLIRSLVKREVPIGGYGIGTHLTTCADAPYLNCAYKLEEYDGQPRRKRSSGKATWPGAKQLYRYVDESGLLRFDRLCTAREPVSGGAALLQPVMNNGRRLQASEPLERIRERVREQLELLPAPWRELDQPASPVVQVSDALQQLAADTDRLNDGGKG
ncbi:nicotinate phosphoribosyltransferase [Marinobacterium nitratireducens]|uniref:Nicotinate phosphoribosyltransferase n=1 Tax=Marinobacterium nitratireducens TaxID=518897 RepID=A0A917ZNC4_9GAMM|nr:nicotinate phosphoribosyltransferase [Marinobacterium nitratireducens]GGO87154.1 nicotinate phosphoribosyltransferase [Marinobacterium nitratireducens]